MPTANDYAQIINSLTSDPNYDENVTGTVVKAVQKLQEAQIKKDNRKNAKQAEKAAIKKVNEEFLGDVTTSVKSGDAWMGLSKQISDLKKSVLGTPEYKALVAQRKALLAEGQSKIKESKAYKDRLAAVMEGSD